MCTVYTYIYVHVYNCQTKSFLLKEGSGSAAISLQQQRTSLALHSAPLHHHARSGSCSQ